MPSCRTMAKRRSNTASNGNGNVPVPSCRFPITPRDAKHRKPSPPAALSRAQKQSPTKNTPPNKKKPTTPRTKPSTAGVDPRSWYHPKNPALPDAVTSPESTSPRYYCFPHSRTYCNPDVSPTVDRRADPSHHDIMLDVVGLRDAAIGAQNLTEARRRRSEKSARIDDEDCVLSPTARRLISLAQHSVSDLFREWDDVYHKEYSIERVVADFKMQFEDLNCRLNECLRASPCRIASRGANDELHERINKLENDFLDVQVLKSELQLELTKRKSIPLLGFTARFWRSPQIIYCPRIGGPPKINLRGACIVKTSISRRSPSRHALLLPCSQASLITQVQCGRQARWQSPFRNTLAANPVHDRRRRLSPPPRPSPCPVFAPPKPNSDGASPACTPFPIPISSCRSHPVPRLSLPVSRGVAPSGLQTTFVPEMRTGDLSPRRQSGRALVTPHARDGLRTTPHATPGLWTNILRPHTARAVLQGCHDHERCVGRLTRVHAH